MMAIVLKSSRLRCFEVIRGLSSDWFVPYVQGMTPANQCTGASW